MKTQALLDLAEAIAAAKDTFAPFAEFVAARGGRGFFYGFAALSSDLSQIGFTGGLHFHHNYGREWERYLPWAGHGAGLQRRRGRVWVWRRWGGDEGADSNRPR